MKYEGDRVRLDLPALDAGESATFAAPPGEEAVLVLLRGEVRWNSRVASRTDVFAEPASAVYLPSGASVEVIAPAGAELALAATRDARVDTGAEPVFVAPADVVAHERGAPGWQRRVDDVVVANVDARALMVGETFTAPGQWSSFPPHKHDGRDGEPALEEVYYFRFDPPDGFGFQGLYEAGGDEHATLVRHGTIVGIPRGYHPACAAPGYRMYYLWALVGSPRQLVMHEDPAHRWLNEKEASAR